MLDTLEDRHFTVWHDVHVKPADAGPYQCLYPLADGQFVTMYSLWTGTYWTVVKPHPDDLRQVPTRRNKPVPANQQNIEWRGLTEQGFKYLETLIEARKLKQAEDRNLKLLDEVKQLERDAAEAKRNADGEYLRFLKLCDEDPQIAAKAKKLLGTSDLASQRPSSMAEDYQEYAEGVDGAPDEVELRLLTARSAAEGRKQYWKIQWHQEGPPSKIGSLLNKDKRPRPTVERTPRRMIGIYEEEAMVGMPPNLPPPFSGSFGSGTS